MKLVFVIQRYGLEVAGGAELHCRWLVNRLARRHKVEVLTTCALDYLEWRNHYPPGPSVVEGVPVRRYPVRRPRSIRRFGLISDLVFREEHSPRDEEEWVKENGPDCPELVRALTERDPPDLFVFYCYRYYHSFFGLPRVANRAVLVPTAEEDEAIKLPIFRDLFAKARGIVYLTPEEKSLVEGTGAKPPNVVAGSGLNVPDVAPGLDVRTRFGLPERYLLYAGRIDRNKGVDRLVTDYLRLAVAIPDLPPLVLVGKSVLDLPADPLLRLLGYVTDEEKYALLAGCEVFLIPSAFESLSIVTLEAWAMGRPVLANAACRVLVGQCERSGGGLFYRGYSEFAATLRFLLERPDLRRQLGESGRAYVKRECDWDLVDRRADEFLEIVHKSSALVR